MADKHINDKITAYHKSPHNLDLLYDIVKLCRKREKYELAYQYAQLYMNMSNKDDKIRKQDILYELSLICWYVNQYDQGYRVSEQLLFDKKVSQIIKNTVHQNLIYYIKPISYHQSIHLTFPLPPIDDNKDETWQPLNPSIIKTDTGYLVNCRLVNYKKIGDNFIYLTNNKIIQNRNIILTLDKNFQLLTQSELFDHTLRQRFLTSIIGPEDCRIIPWNNDIIFSCTILDTNPHQIPQIGLGKLPLVLPLPEKLSISQLQHLKAFTNQHEKNWLPFIVNDSLKIIYSYDPLIILKPDLNTGHCSIEHNHPTFYDFHRFRGGAPPIPFDDGYLLIVHEVVINLNHYYYNRFVWIDKTYHIRKISPLFTLLNKQIEYCSGLSYTHQPNQLVVSLGINDREAWLFTFDIQYIQKLLFPISKL